MQLRYFYSKEIDQKNKTVTIRDDETHHMITVNRLKVGDHAYVINGKGIKALIKITAVSKQCVNGEILKIEERDFYTMWPTISLFPALSKKTSFSTIVEKAVEIGVCAIFPFIAERSVVKVNDVKKFEGKYTKIIRSAMKQSHCLDEPTLFLPYSFPDLMDMLASSDHFWSNDENKKHAPLKLLLDPYANNRLWDIVEKEKVDNGGIFDVEMVIGPEGGLTDQEKKEFVSRGFIGVSLPGNILRAETAVIAALSMLKYCTNSFLKNERK